MAMLDLSRQPSTAEAEALVQRLSVIVERAAPPSRLGVGRERLSDTLGRFSWPLLASSASDGTGEVIVPLDEAWFTGKAVAAPAFKRVVRGLQRAQLIR